MALRPADGSTIAAVATPYGSGGIGIVRLSGGAALSIALILTQRARLTPRHAHLVRLSGPDGELIDQAMVLYFPAPNSYTGEELIEFHCHGNPLLLEHLVTVCRTLGARDAEAGEFTLRAYLNGKLDLTQAEAVADTIHARTLEAARASARTIDGEFAAAIGGLLERVVSLRALVESELDFADDVATEISGEELRQRCDQASAASRALLAQCRQGHAMVRGVTIVISGPPNVGKSTLINRLAGEEVSIVTPLSGTTRDLVRQSLSLDGLPVELIDSAGIHQTSDPIEQLGIERAEHALDTADLALVVGAAGQGGSEAAAQQQAIVARLQGAAVDWIVVENKIDRTGAAAALTEQGGVTTVAISAASGEGVELLLEAIRQKLGMGERVENRFTVARRVVDRIATVDGELQQLNKALQKSIEYELVAETLREIHQLLALTLADDEPTESLLDSIFTRFCIGK